MARATISMAWLVVLGGMGLLAACGGSTTSSGPGVQAGGSGGSSGASGSGGVSGMGTECDATHFCISLLLCIGCPDGSSVCPTSQCVNGHCVTSVDPCPGSSGGSGGSAGAAGAGAASGVAGSAGSGGVGGYYGDLPSCTGVQCLDGDFCTCCPGGGPTQHCACTQLCTSNAGCYNPAAPLCDVDPSNKQGFCHNPSYQCCWGCK